MALVRSLLAAEASRERARSAYLMRFGGIALFAGIITAMDLLARRQRRRSQKGYAFLPVSLWQTTAPSKLTSADPLATERCAAPRGLLRDRSDAEEEKFWPVLPREEDYLRQARPDLSI